MLSEISYHSALNRRNNMADFLPESCRIEKDQLLFNNVPVTSLTKKYGTPLYLLSENTIIDNCKKYVNAIKDNYNGYGMPLFASKALSCIGLYKIIKDQNLGIDVVSGGELYTAIKAGFDTDKIYFHGNNKTDEELLLAINNNVGHIVVDNIFELDKLNKLAGTNNKKINISFRIKPGVDAHTHAFVRTGFIDSKFGVALENDEAFELIKYTLTLKNIDLKGLHFHIGSQIFEYEPFCLASEKVLDLMLRVRKELGFTLRELNIGGGIGIRYTEDDNPYEINEYFAKICNAIKYHCSKNDFPLPFLVCEPGRSIVANAGITAYTIGSIKDIKDIRTYISVDGGMTDNPRYILYQSKYSMTIANKASQAKDKKVTVAGKCCESGDLIQENIFIQSPEVNDILVVFDTGAYNYSMSSNYNRIPRPPIVILKDEEDRLLVRRETYEDIIKNDII